MFYCSILHMVEQVSAGLLGSTSAFCQGNPGSNPITAPKILRSLSWFGLSSTVESLPCLLLQCLALSMDEQYAVWYQHATKVLWLLAQKGFDDQ